MAIVDELEIFKIRCLGEKQKKKIKQEINEGKRK